jgi:glycerol-3-phosphate O-acyltransferase/dihydroxyacetone phosphate acyltransferase
VVATWKVLISLGFAPVLYGFYAFLATLVAVRAGAGFQWRIFTPIILLATLPFVGFAALKFGEAGMDVLKCVDVALTWAVIAEDGCRSLRPLIVSLAPGQQRSLVRLKQMRTTLSNELVDVINTFGPQYYEDFDEVNMDLLAGGVHPLTSF